MQTQQVNIKDLKFGDYNPRKMTEEQISDLKESITRFGLVQPIIVNSNPERINIIIGGHQRVRVAQMLGMNEVPVLYVPLDENKEKELNIRLNKNLGQWDWDKLANQFDVEDLTGWGFDPRDFGMGEPPEEPEVSKIEESSTEAVPNLCRTCGQPLPSPIEV